MKMIWPFYSSLIVFKYCVCLRWTTDITRKRNLSKHQINSEKEMFYLFGDVFSQYTKMNMAVLINSVYLSVCIY